MGLFGRLDVCVVVSLLVCIVILDNCIVDDRRRTVIADDGGAVYTGQSDFSVIASVIEMAPVDDNGAVNVCMAANVDADAMDVDIVYDHRMRPSPGAAAVVDFPRRQRHPAHGDAAVNPGDPPRIPEEADVEKGEADAPACNWRGPAPAVSDIDPVAVMVGDVAEGLRRNPGQFPRPVGPAPHSERGPAPGNSSRLPEPALLPLVEKLLPFAVFFKGVGLIAEFRRKILVGRSRCLFFSQPEIFTGHVPPVPIGIHLAFA